MILGCDLHPRYQAGISIEQIRREGLDFMAVKLTDGTNFSFAAAGSADFLRRGKAAGMICCGYHYLRAGNEAEQAKVFATQLRALQVPGMLDAEEGAGNISNIRAFVDAMRRLGAPLPLMYLPRWYWQKIGSPSLAGLPPLWASRYVTGTGKPGDLYGRHNPAGWDPYGGLRVEVLQFSDQGQVAGRQIDVDAYRGSREQFAALIGAAAAKEEDIMASIEDLRTVLRAELPGMLQRELDDPIARQGGETGNTSVTGMVANLDAMRNAIFKRLDAIDARLGKLEAAVKAANP